MESAPIPWNVLDLQSTIFIKDKKGNLLADVANKANAEFIIRACNCHYDLLTALKFAKSVVQSGELWTETCEKMIDGIIAKAEGK